LEPIRTGESAGGKAAGLLRRKAKWKSDMTTTMQKTETVQEKSEAHSVFELVNRGLDDVRRRVDEMLVRLDVGELNLRGEVHSDLDRAVNMALLAKSRLLHLGHHLGSRFAMLPTHDHEHPQR
jgi:hypothetical protein